MARFLDVHSMKGLNEDTLKALQKSSEDECKVTHLNIMYNPEVDKCFCLLEAPSLEAVEKNHEKLGIRCDWITEVKTTS
jgi:Nickel responsive protein SCO4226-like